MVPDDWFGRRSTHSGIGCMGNRNPIQVEVIKFPYLPIVIDLVSWQMKKARMNLMKLRGQDYFPDIIKQLTTEHKHLRLNRLSLINLPFDSYQQGFSTHDTRTLTNSAPMLVLATQPK